MAKKNKTLKDLKNRFVYTMKSVAALLNIAEEEVSRDEYVRTSVDCDIPDRLNKEDLNSLGGFRKARTNYFGIKKVDVQRPKVLIFDIETAPMLGHVWSLWDNNVALNQLEKDWHILSWAAKWLDDPPSKVMYQDQRKEKNIEDDKKLLEGIWKLLDEADVVITQNGKSFDVKKLNARFVLSGMKPPSSFKHIDTKIIAKKHFAFTSNRLEYMTENLCKHYKKLKKTKLKFAGFELWKECLAGNLEAWKEMERYNRYDVLSLEELYGILIPWDNTVDFNLYSDGEEYVCRCGSKQFRECGFYYTQSGKFQKYACKRCGTETRSSENLFSKAKKKSLRRKVAR